jgi:hypothetical protein
MNIVLMQWFAALVLALLIATLDGYKYTLSAFCVWLFVRVALLSVFIGCIRILFR